MDETLALLLNNPNYVEVNGELVHKSRLSEKIQNRDGGHRIADNLAQGTGRKPAKQAKGVVPRLKKGLPDDPGILSLYAQAKAVLVVPGKARSNNSIKWRHWSAHHADRREARARVKNGIWELPFDGKIPQHPAEQRVRLEIIKYGGRIMDKMNFSTGCKSIVDELVVLGFLKDDSPMWLEDDYHQVKGSVGMPRIEILFLDPKGNGPAKM